jgi:hypothetical protein
MEACASPDPIERRARVRYPVQLNVRYRTTDSRHNVSGVGMTLNMSSGGLLVACQHELTLGARIEAQLDWPTLLDSRIPLQRVTVGRVVRSYSSTFALEFSQYEFRTMRTRPALEALQFQQSA